MPDPRPAQPNSDQLFRRLLIAATAFALAVMIASVGSIRPGGDGLRFVWHWPVLIWSALGGLCAWPFWRFVWAVQDRPTPRNKLRLALFCLLMLALGLAGFLYPLRFTNRMYRNDLIAGLALAVLVLSSGGSMLYFLGRAFTRADTPAQP